MNEKERLGRKIKAIRKQQKLTQEKLSEIVEISPRQMVKIEMGQAYPSLKTLMRIAGALNVPLQSLFENEDYDNLQNLRKKIHEKIDCFDEKTTRFLYLVISNLN